MLDACRVTVTLMIKARAFVFAGKWTILSLVR
jgi:hypothetical protein